MSARWADLTIRLVVKANSMSARWADLTIRLVVKANSMSARWADLTIRLVVKANSMSARKCIYVCIFDDFKLNITLCSLGT